MQNRNDHQQVTSRGPDDLQAQNEHRKCQVRPAATFHRAAVNHRPVRRALVVVHAACGVVHVVRRVDHHLVAAWADQSGRLRSIASEGMVVRSENFQTRTTCIQSVCVYLYTYWEGNETTSDIHSPCCLHAHRACVLYMAIALMWKCAKGNLYARFRFRFRYRAVRLWMLLNVKIRADLLTPEPHHLGPQASASALLIASATDTGNEATNQRLVFVLTSSCLSILLKRALIPRLISRLQLIIIS